MIQILAVTAALALFGAAPATTLQRGPHDDTIYIVQGTPDQLIRFQKEIGSKWKGGRLLKKENGIYDYWAFPDRTAPQARELMLGAIVSGLTLGIREYDQSQWFPAARSKLDNIAISCGLIRDPFFITPGGELQVKFHNGDPSEAVGCAKRKLETAKLPDVSAQQTN